MSEETKKSKFSTNKLMYIPILLGLLILVPVAFQVFYSIIVGPLQSNSAEQKMMPLTSYLKLISAKKLCEESYNGASIFDINGPSYTVYFSVPEKSFKKEVLLQKAHYLGINLEVIENTPLNEINYGDLGDENYWGIKRSGRGSEVLTVKIFHDSEIKEARCSGEPNLKPKKGQDILYLYLRTPKGN